jgi:hypothetical protein
MAAVAAIELQGAPDHIYLDERAVRTPGGTVPPGLTRKAAGLSGHLGIAVSIVAAPRNPSAETAVPHIHIESGGLSPDTIAGFEVTGPAETEEVLGLFGTALVQEQASVASHALSQGERPPAAVPFDQTIMSGIGRILGARRGVPYVVHAPYETETVNQRAEWERDPAAFMAAVYEPLPRVFARNGAIAAAPPAESAAEPDYWYFWQRDAAQIALAAHRYANFVVDPEVQSDIGEHLSRYLGFVKNLPEAIVAGGGDLGVSRCRMDGEPILTYGNPQHDGPALTALAVMAIEPDKAKALETARPYLEYLTALPLDAKSFDPWEFAAGEIFNAKNLGRRALRRASLIATELDPELAETYHAKERTMQRYLEQFNDRSYTSAGRDYLLPWFDHTSGLDVNVVGSILPGYDVTDHFMAVDDPRMVRTMDALGKAFEAKGWPVNAAWRQTHKHGLGLGRFPEDANDGIGATGGNPWVFATLWAAQYYLRRQQLSEYLGEPANPAWLEKADGYLDFVLAHVPKDAVTEQINGFDGKPSGAKQLAWARAELLNTLVLRNAQRPQQPVKLVQ